MAQSLQSRQILGSLEGCTELKGRMTGGCGIYEGVDTFIGRDSNACHLVLDNPTVSNKHVRLYSIHYDSEIEPLIYAQDVSANGTFWLYKEGNEWRERLIGNGNQVLLSQGDKLRLSHSPGLCFEFRSHVKGLPANHDRIQDPEMRSFSNVYRVTKRRLGSGAQGEILLAIGQIDNRQYACKKVDLRKARLLYESLRNRTGKHLEFAGHDLKGSNNSTGIGLEEKWLREVKILKSTSHPNIIAVHRVFRSDNTLYIIQDLLSGGDLFSYIEYKNGRLGEHEASFILFQLLHAVEYIHGEGVVHRDLKPANILLTSRNENVRVVITDFGHAINLNDGGKSRIRRMDSLVGTADFTAPEVYENSKSIAQRGYTKAIDMWSVGCVMTALLTGQSYFDDSQISAMKRNSSEALREAAVQCDLRRLEHGHQWKHVSSTAKDLVRKTIVRDETERLRVEQALRHQWFTIDVRGADLDERYKRVVMGWKRHHPVVDFEERLEPWIDFDLRYREPRRLMPPPPRPLPSRRDLEASGRSPPQPPPPSLKLQNDSKRLRTSPYFQQSYKPKAKDIQSLGRSPLQDTISQPKVMSRPQEEMKTNILSSKRRRSTTFDYEDYEIHTVVAKENSPWMTAFDYGQKVKSKYQEYRSRNQESPCLR